MNRPGPVGTTMLLAFGLVAVIEFRTVLAMLGVEIPVGPYFGASVGAIGIGLALLYLVSEDHEGKATSA